MLTFTEDVKAVHHNILYIDNTQGLYGGGQISLLELLKQLNKSKFRPVVALGEQGKLLEGIERIGVQNEIIPMPAIRPHNLVPCIGSVRKLKYLIRSRRISLVHTNTSRATIYACFAARKLGVPIIWHARIPHPDRLLDRFLIPRCSRIIAVSKAVKRRFHWLKKDSVEVIYNGVDTDRFAPRSAQNNVKQKFQIASQDIVIGTVGRISSEKGLEFLISAMRDVVKVYPQTRVLILGTGDMEYYHALLARINGLSLSSNIIFAGFREDIPEILSCTDIYCLPSLTEGFNRTLLEAMACGLPIITTSVGGNVEIVQDGLNGLLVPPGNPSALASAIIELLQNKTKAQKMGTEGRRLVEQNFNIQTNVNQIQELYFNLIKSN